MNHRLISMLLVSTGLLAGCADFQAPNPAYPVKTAATPAISAPQPLAPAEPAPSQAAAPTADEPAAMADAKPLVTVLPTLLDAQTTEAMTTCATIANRPPVTLLPEAQAIAETGGAMRQGTLLRVGAAQFEDRPVSANGPVSYRYVASYRGLSADLLQVTEGSKSSYILLDRHTGSQIGLMEVPTPSPDGHYFAAASVRQFDFSGVEVIEHLAGGWAPRAKLRDAAAPCDLHWISADSFAVRIWNTGARRDAVIQPVNEVWTTTVR